jgi:hypothetical protein
MPPRQNLYIDPKGSRKHYASKAAGGNTQAQSNSNAVKANQKELTVQLKKFQNVPVQDNDVYYNSFNSFNNIQSSQLRGKFDQAKKRSVNINIVRVSNDRTPRTYTFSTIPIIYASNASNINSAHQNNINNAKNNSTWLSSMKNHVDEYVTSHPLNLPSTSATVRMKLINRRKFVIAVDVIGKLDIFKVGNLKNELMAAMNVWLLGFNRQFRNIMRIDLSASPLHG